MRISSCIGNAFDADVHSALSVVPILPFVGIGVLERKDCSRHANTLRCGQELISSAATRAARPCLWRRKSLECARIHSYIAFFETPRCPASAVTE